MSKIFPARGGNRSPVVWPVASRFTTERPRLII